MELIQRSLMRDPFEQSLGDNVVQRRRKPRSKPRDVFSKSGSSQSKSPSQPSSPPPRMPEVEQPATPKAAPIPAKEPESKATKSEKDTVELTEPVIEGVQESIIEEQLLREPRKGIGLRSSETESGETEEADNQTSKRAQDIIDKSKARASQQQRARTVKKAPESTAPPVQVKRRRRVKPSFQPAERKKRLDRSRHMEYKYEVRRLLVDIKVAEEHRSSILGSVWAKGERQTVSDAKEFLSEKYDEGILDDTQFDAMSKIVDNYTVRR
tara:strand:+ start:1370 stop:2173 length:804 start_codon:yes stop_codon:yes gene_type:complete